MTIDTAINNKESVDKLTMNDGVELKTIDARTWQKANRKLYGSSLIDWAKRAKEARDKNYKNICCTMEDGTMIDAFRRLKLRSDSEIGTHTSTDHDFITKNARYEPGFYNWICAVGSEMAIRRRIIVEQLRRAALNTELIERGQEILLLNIHTMELESVEIDHNKHKAKQRYIAISHSWGPWQTGNDRFALGGLQDVPVLDQTKILPTLRSIVDYVTNYTNYSYVWVDWACVDQEDNNNQADDLWLQRTVYALADKVISVMRGSIGRFFERIKNAWFYEEPHWFNHNCDMEAIKYRSQFWSDWCNSPQNRLSFWEGEDVVMNERWLNSEWTIQESLMVMDFICIGMGEQGQLISIPYSALMGYLSAAFPGYKNNFQKAQMQAFSQKLYPTSGIAALSRLAKRCGNEIADLPAYSYMAPGMTQRPTFTAGSRSIMDMSAACDDITVLSANAVLMASTQCIWHETGMKDETILSTNKAWHFARIRYGKDVAYVYDPIQMEIVAHNGLLEKWIILGSVLKYQYDTLSTHALAVRVVHAWRGSNMLHALESRLFNVDGIIKATYTSMIHECLVIGVTTVGGASLCYDTANNIK